MSRFFHSFTESMQHPLFRRRITNLFILFAGGIAGYSKALWIAEKNNKNYTLDHLTPYENEDAINATIAETKKPAVIYYYLPQNIFSPRIRYEFIRASAKYHEKANFYLVNLKKHFLQAKQELKHEFPVEMIFIEARFPKQNCEIEWTDGEKEERFVERRELYSFGVERGWGIYDFLEICGIKSVEDQLSPFMKLTNQSLFDPLP